MLKLRDGEILLESEEVKRLAEILNNILTYEDIRFLGADSLEFLIDKVNFMLEDS
jgi:hypothetical protein